jgi:hypothetical protein
MTGLPRVQKAVLLIVLMYAVCPRGRGRRIIGNKMGAAL